MSRVSIPDLGEIVGVFRKEYAKTPKLVKVVDCFIVYAVTTALLQYSYMLICGSFPYNAFLAGLGCSLGFAILTVCFRMQINEGKMLEKVFADYCVACIFLFLVAISYVG